MNALCFSPLVLDEGLVVIVCDLNLQNIDYFSDGHVILWRLCFWKICEYVYGFMKMLNPRRKILLMSLPNDLKLIEKLLKTNPILKMSCTCKKKRNFFQYLVTSIMRNQFLKFCIQKHFPLHPPQLNLTTTMFGISQQ